MKRHEFKRYSIVGKRMIAKEEGNWVKYEEARKMEDRLRRDIEHFVDDTIRQYDRAEKAEEKIKELEQEIENMRGDFESMDCG